MMFYGYINLNIDRIRKEVQFGLIPCSILRHWEIYSRYDAYKKMGHNTVEATLFTSSDMKISERNVFKIIKKMEQEI